MYMDKNVSRRNFVSGAAATGVALGAAAMVPAALAEEAAPVANSEGAGDWLGEAPEISASDIVNTL